MKKILNFAFLTLCAMGVLCSCVKREEGETVREAMGQAVFDGLPFSSDHVLRYSVFEETLPFTEHATERYIVMYDDMEEGCDHEIIYVSMDVYDGVVRAKRDGFTYTCILRYIPGLTGLWGENAQFNN